MTERKQWIKALSLSNASELNKLWEDLQIDVDFKYLSGPETGLLTCRGKMGGTGNSFNLGDISVTRCSVQLASGEIGTSIQTGTNHNKSKYAALIDALMQTDQKAMLQEKIINPLVANREEKAQARQAEIMSSKVDFYTMVRGG